MEGHLPCVKFLVSEGPSPTHILGARNDTGETPKMLSHQFYKQQVVDYITNIEWERDHPEETESESRFHPVGTASGCELSSAVSEVLLAAFVQRAHVLFAIPLPEKMTCHLPSERNMRLWRKISRGSLLEKMDIPLDASAN